MKIRKEISEIHYGDEIIAYIVDGEIEWKTDDEDIKNKYFIAVNSNNVFKGERSPYKYQEQIEKSYLAWHNKIHSNEPTLLSKLLRLGEKEEDK